MRQIHLNWYGSKGADLTHRPVENLGSRCSGGLWTSDQLTPPGLLGAPSRRAQYMAERGVGHAVQDVWLITGAVDARILTIEDSRGWEELTSTHGVDVEVFDMAAFMRGHVEQETVTDIDWVALAREWDAVRITAMWPAVDYWVTPATVWLNHTYTAEYLGPWVRPALLAAEEAYEEQVDAEIEAAARRRREREALDE